MRMVLWAKVRKLIGVTDVAPRKGWVHESVKYGTYAKCNSCSTQNVFKFSAAKEVTKLRCAECRAKGSLHILEDYRGFSFNHEEKRFKILDVDVYGFDLEDEDVTMDFKWKATMMDEDGSKIGIILEGTLNDDKCLYFDMVAEPEQKEEEEEEEEEDDDDEDDESQNKDHEYDSTDEENADDEDEIKEKPGVENIEAYWMNDED